MPPARTRTVALTGVRGHLVEIEADVTNGAAGMTLAGLPETGTREMHDRVRAAVINSGLAWPQRTITVTASPASLPKRGSAFDTAIAVAVLAADETVPPTALADVVFLAELGLDGALRPVPGVLPAVTAAAAAGFGTVVVAAENAAEAAIVPGIRMVPASSLADLLTWLRGGPAPSRIPRQADTPPAPARGRMDLADVPGQPEARHAAEISAAGGHSLFLLGPAGAGATMIAERLPTILPPLEVPAALEVAAIRSVAGMLPPRGGLITEPPFLALPHTAGMAPSWAAAAASSGPGRHRSPTTVSCSSTGPRSFRRRRWTRCASRWKPAR